MVRTFPGLVFAALLAFAGGASAAGTRVTVVRAGCFFGCPEFALTVGDNGVVAYKGWANVDIEGLRTWKLSDADVMPLLAMARDPSLWAAEDRYHERVYDGETVLVRVSDGDRRKQIVLYPFGSSQRPEIVVTLVRTLEQTTGVGRWVRISGETIAELKAEGFDFGSQASGKIFERAVQRNAWAEQGDIDEAALLQWLSLGAPVGASATPSGETALSGALAQRLHLLTEPLLARKVLETNGRPDQAKIDAAFRAAIRGGRLAPVQRIWNAYGPQWRPALEYTPYVRDGAGKPRSYSVVLLLERSSPEVDWEGLQIVRWLDSVGAELAARSVSGSTLFDLASRLENPGFMRFLLGRGLDPTVLHEREMMRFSVHQGEDMALELIEASLRHDPAWQVPGRYRAVAELQEWNRVLAWLDANPDRVREDARSPCP